MDHPIAWDPELWFTREEVAAILRCSPQTVDKLRSDGTLPSRKVGRLVRIHRDDVAALRTPAA